MSAPHPNWIPFLKLLFGFLMLLMLSILAIIIALGKVEMQTSYGLSLIIGGLLTMSGAFSGWAFKEKSGRESDKTDEPNK